MIRAWERGFVSLKIGDRLEIELEEDNILSKIYSHWGIVIKMTSSNVDYMEFTGPPTTPGAGAIAQVAGHIASVSSTSATQSGSPPSFKEKNVTEITTKVRVNNKRDSTKTPSTEEEMQRRIKDVSDHASMFPEMVDPYNSVTNNCEHFVNYIRYGEKFSDQTRNTVLAGALAAKVACNIQ